MNASGAVLGVDPGRDKAGFALVNESGEVIRAGVVAVASLADQVRRLQADYPIGAVALGGGTNAAALRALLREFGVPIHDVDEFETSRRARELYFRDHPPRGWRRLIPAGMHVPPVPIDDYAAILIARRFLTRDRG